MISNFDKCLFVHIPKVAGQSIESVFLERAGLTWQQRERMLLRTNFDSKMGPPRLAHLTAQEYLDLGYLNKQNFDSYFKFSFVRNPWDRLVSEYVYRKYAFSFKDFLFKHFPTANNDNYQDGFDAYRHVIPQSSFLYDDHGNLLVDFVGKYESLNEDFSILSKRVTGDALLLPHRNKSKESFFQVLLKNIIPSVKKKHYSEYYDKESEEFVSYVYQQDITFFDYKFDY